jgi:uncharacterized protein
MRSIGLVFSFFLFLSLAACADDAVTFNGMLALANKGDPEAQYHVGMMYNNGIGTAQDPKQAFGWFQKSATANDPLGAFKLGCYYAGQFKGVVKIDEVAALKYKLVAAQAGYSLAQHEVAVYYARAGNFEEAVKWLKLASAQGLDLSLYGLSNLYHDGKGVPKDVSLAFVYLTLAGQVSDTNLKDKAKGLLDDMGAQMSPSDHERAQKLISEWTPQLSALTIKAKGGITEAEDYLQRTKQ